MTASEGDVRTIPTVVVARRARDGVEREFEEWLRRLHTAAHEAPGHLRSTVQPPNERHPGEWMIVYQFDTAAHRTEWLDSPTRRSLVAEGSSLVDGSPREQVIALAPEDEPVTAVASFQLGSGSGERFDRFRRELAEALARFSGFRGMEVYEPVRGVQDDTVIAFSFDTRAHLDDWLDSDERRRLIESIDPITEGERVVNVVDASGAAFGGWFESGDEPAPVTRWKQAAIVLLALFPTALLLTLLRNALLPDLPLVPSVLLANIGGVAILTWVLMPWLTGLLDRWLRR